MKQKIIFLCVTVLMSIAHSYGGVTVTVPDVCIAPGGTAYVVINADFGSQPNTAYQFDIAYPDGITAVVDNEGNPTFRLGDGMYSEKHLVSSAFSPTGLSRFQCFSLTSDALTAQSGRLLLLLVKARAGLAVGTYQATISPMEFVQTDATPDRPEAVTFNIVVSRQVVLDEEATLAPTAAPGVNVSVKRTINANEWSTICLPFAMTEAQITEAFGDGVQIGDFGGYDVADGGETIRVLFSTATAMEANHPYIIRVRNDISEFSVDHVDVDPQEAVVDLGTIRKPKAFVGNYVAGTQVENGCLFLSKGKFWYSVGETKMKAYRGYFNFFDLLPDFEANYAAARVLLTFSEATGISGVNHAVAGDGRYYDLRGQRVENPGKGLYMMNNRKVLVK